MLLQAPPARVDGGFEYVLPEKEPMIEIAALDRRLILTFASATLVAILLTLLLSRRITQPIERLTKAVDDMARGARPEHVEVAGRDEIARLAHSFNAMSDSITQQQELRRRMVGDVAHELRTPLTNLRCELEAVQDGLSAPNIPSLHEEVLHLGRLVDDLQELAVADAGALPLHREPIDLGLTISRVVETFRAPITINAEQVMVNADPMRVGQIVRNLLSNAVQHSTGEISVSVTHDGSLARVAVANDGPRIPEAELANIFERFYRVDASRAGGGAGLGLAIVRRLVELHGGRVWAENSAMGVVFVFTLP